MPDRQRAGLKGFYLELEPALIEQVKDLASRTGRNFKDEVKHALERHLAAPPVVVMTVPSLPPAQVERQTSPPHLVTPSLGDEKPRKRTRKPKAPQEDKP